MRIRKLIELSIHNTILQQQPHQNVRFCFITLVIALLTALLLVVEHPIGILAGSLIATILALRLATAMRDKAADATAIAPGSSHQNILSSMPMGLLTLDREGRITTFNAMAEAITGLKAEGVQGISFEDQFTDNIQLTQIIAISRQHRAPLTTTGISFCNPDGRILPVALRTAMLPDDTGDMVGMLAIIEDLSPQQASEQHLHRADQLAALGQMAAGIAHEIKNPLTSIRTFVQLVERKHDDPGFIEKFMRVVPRELDRMNLVIEELLDLSRPTHLDPLPIDIVCVLQGVIEVYSERMRQQGIAFKSDFSVAFSMLSGDAERLHRAFANIMLNAIESMPSGGKLTITCRPERQALIDVTAPVSERRDDTNYSNPNERSQFDIRLCDLEIAFSDSGPGISPEQLDRVFTPFHTTKPKGTGLGLAITHKVIEEHGGTMQITSRVGHGTTVTLKLPASTNEPTCPS